MSPGDCSQFLNGSTSATPPLQIDGLNLLEVLGVILSYAPIPLFAESLRVQKGLVAVILNSASTPFALTGCIKDFARLWDIDDVSLFGHFSGSETACVTSRRHGNSFQLMNKTILDQLGITSRRVNSQSSQIGSRVTSINLSLVVPLIQSRSSKADERFNRLCNSITLIETLVLLGLGFVMVMHQLIAGAVLMGCMAATLSTMLILRWCCRLIFANVERVHKACQNGVEGGSSLDVHVIASNWNSSQLDVICGFSSHLHALTNIPVRINKPSLLTWASRFLAVILTLQATVLASLSGTKGANNWFAGAWLVLYFIMLIPNRLLARFSVLGSSPDIKDFPTSVTLLQPVHFSSRRAALTFIAMLPASPRAQNKWAWTDVFMPDNKRRQQLEAELDSCESISSTKLNYKNIPDFPGLGTCKNKHGHGIDDNSSVADPSSLSSISLSTQSILREAQAAYKNNPRIQQSLDKFQKVVYTKQHLKEPPTV